MRHQQLQCYYNLNSEVISKELEYGFLDTVSTEVLYQLGLNVTVADNPCWHYIIGKNDCYLLILQCQVGTS